MAADVPNPTPEGLDTFIARLTLEVVTKVVEEIRGIREKGKSEPDIQKMIEKTLRSYDAFTRARIYQKSLDARLVDDFPAEQVESCTTPKENTVVLKVKGVPDGVKEETLVQYKGEDYTVGEIRGNAVTLKKLLPLRKKK